MHLLTLYDLEREDILNIIEDGIYFKRHRGKEDPILKGKTIAMIFESPSTRTRVSFDIAIREL